MVQVTFPAGPPQPPKRNRTASDAGSPRHKSDDGLKVLPFTVEWDHRELPAGWRFQGLIGGRSDNYAPLVVPQEKVYLVTADYRIKGVPVYIERKSHDDAIGSIGGGHDRLRAEHERMHEIVKAGGVCCVICETSHSAIIDELSDPDSTRQLDPEAVDGVLRSWPVKYQVPWYFPGSRAAAERFALGFLRKWYEELTGEKG